MTTPHGNARRSNELTVLKRRCVLLNVAAVLLLAAYLGPAQRTIAMGVGRFEARIWGSTLVIGEASDGGAGGGSFIRFSADSYFAAPYVNAWRPFHATSLNVHSLVFPVWQPLLVVTAMAAYGWGKLRGAGQHANPLHCRGCGYSLIGLPETEDQRCPECGREVPKGLAV